MNNPLYHDFKSIVTNNTPLIDVRAPIEYDKGAFPNSINLPIMDDEERRQVGITYKNEGNEVATQLGLSLVSGELKESRIQAWCRFIEQHPGSLLYCFRGGSRSRFTQEWLDSRGIAMQRLEGGYKAFRNYLIEALMPERLAMKPIILGGYTGSGKTILLKKVSNFIDLEGIANHRGSSFGRHATPQPSQINFENQLAYSIIQLQESGAKTMILEDEGIHVGTCYLPKPFFNYTNQGELVILEVSFDQRVQITLDEYVTEAQKEYIQHHNSYEEGMPAWLEYINASIMRLKKRLGDVRMNALLSQVEFAYQHQLRTGEIHAHEAWIATFLKEYYDPMYQYQIDTNTKNIIFTGNESEVLSFLKDA